MSLTEAKKKTLNVLNINYAWSILALTALFALVDYLTAAPLSSNKNLIYIQLVMFAVWIFLVILLTAKWLTKQMKIRKE